MEHYNAEIGVATGLAAGPTVRDMYHVLEKLGKHVEVTRVRIGAVHQNEGMRMPRAFTHIRELEEYARSGDQEYIPLDREGIERELLSGDFDCLRSNLRRLSGEDRKGSYILFHASCVAGELSYQREVFRGKKIAGLVELIFGGVALAASAYGWAVGDSDRMMGSGILVGGAFAADGVRRLISCERRYLCLQLRPTQNDEGSHTLARTLISAVENNAGPEGHS